MHMESHHEVLYIENSKAGRILCRIFLLQMPDWHNLSYNALQARHHTNVYSNTLILQLKTYNTHHFQFFLLIYQLKVQNQPVSGNNPGIFH